VQWRAEDELGWTALEVPGLSFFFIAGYQADGSGWVCFLFWFFFFFFFFFFVTSLFNMYYD